MRNQKKWVCLKLLYYFIDTTYLALKIKQLFYVVIYWVFQRFYSLIFSTFKSSTAKNLVVLLLYFLDFKYIVISFYEW